MRQANAPQVKGAHAFRVGVGQEAPEPSHAAGRVSLPPEQDGGLHTVVWSNWFTGQFGLVPLQLSGRSQTPAETRQDVPAFPAGNTHPLVGSHPSAVHGLESSQVGAGPPTQLPPAHLSAVVQALPSSQAFVLFVKMHPVAVSQESSVQGLLSLQVMVEPAQAPAMQ